VAPVLLEGDLGVMETALKVPFAAHKVVD